MRNSRYLFMVHIYVPLILIKILIKTKIKKILIKKGKRSSSLRFSIVVTPQEGKWVGDRWKSSEEDINYYQYSSLGTG